MRPIAGLSLGGAVLRERQHLAIHVFAVVPSEGGQASAWDTKPVRF